jgi:hypothetical protein
MLPLTTLESTNFAGHESFPLRYAWLKKGFDCLLISGPKAFSNDEALVELGVGKNMVRAIRHWGLVCGVWQEEKLSRGRELKVTPLGWMLLADAQSASSCPKSSIAHLPESVVNRPGLDPYLQSGDTWWFLHSQIVGNAKEATSWTWLFNRPKSARFEKADLVAELSELASNVRGSRVSEATIRRDVDVLVRSYVRSRAVDLGDEDSLDSPFVSLGLLRNAPERNAYELVDGQRVRIPSWVVLSCLSNFWSGKGNRGSRSIGLDELVYGTGSPGRVFRLSEEGVVSHVERLAIAFPNLLTFNDTAGLRQLLVARDLPKTEDIVRDHRDAQKLGAGHAN